MKKVIVNNDKIRVTANGQSIVEGSFARVTEIKGKSLECKNLLKTLPLEQINSAEDVSNYATITRSNSGGYDVFIKQKPENGVKYIAFTLDLKNLLHSGTYFLSGSCKHKNNDYYLVYLHLFGYYTDGTRFTFNDVGEGTEVFIDPKKEIREVYCYFQFDFNNDTENFLPNRHFTFFPMLNEGSSPLPYQPYFEGLKHSEIKGIYSNNRNLLSKKQSIEISEYSGEAYFDNGLIDLINSKKINHLTASCLFTSNKINWLPTNYPKIAINLIDQVEVGNASYSYYKTYNGISQKREVTYSINKNYKISSGLVWFNDFGGTPIGVTKGNSFISVQNQLEIGSTPTRYVETESYQYDLPSNITLKSIDNLCDIYLPEQNIIIKSIVEDNLSTNEVNPYDKVFTFNKKFSNINEDLSKNVAFIPKHKFLNYVPTSEELQTLTEPIAFFNTYKYLSVAYPTIWGFDSNLRKMQSYIGDTLDVLYNSKQAETIELNKNQFNGYKVFNNGYEKLLTNLDSDNLTCFDYGAIPEVTVEYEVEEKQGADGSRFDFITLDGEAICGIGYEKLKSTNQLQYVSEPSRQNDGSMANIEDYDTFVLPALEIGFNCLNEYTYRRLKQKLISKRTFDVGYYDKDLDKVVTMEMYVKPIDLDNFLSRGDEIIGMNATMAFVPTLNEETLFTVEFLNANYSTNTSYRGDNGVAYGRAITTPTLPYDYNYWLVIENGFKENSYVKIKGNKKLSIFGNTKLIAIK